MECIQLYSSMVQGLARRFSKSEENCDDLVQEGYLKLLKIVKAQPPNTDWATEDWRKKLYVIVKNAMIDVLRKQIRSKKSLKFECEFSDPLSNPTITPDPKDNFKEIAFKFATQELARLLPDIEKRILQEMLSPSQDFLFFAQKKRTIQSCARKKYKFHFRNEDEEGRDLTIAEFLHLDECQYSQAILHIREVATKHQILDSQIKNR